MRKLALAVTLALAAPAVAQSTDWYFAHIPDTQWYTYGATTPPSFPHFANMTWQMTRWHPSPSYVAHVGDLTQNGTHEEFGRGRWAMRLLGGIPWGVSIGNHDYTCGLSQIPSTPCGANFRAWIGPENFANVVSTPEGDVRFLHLEFNPRDIEALTFARAELGAVHLPTAVVMHGFLGRPPGTPSGGYYTSGQIERIGSNLVGATTNSPRDVWAKIVEPYPEVFMVISGHGYNIVRDTKTTRLGREVQLHAFNLQNDPWGGGGYVRLYRFQGRTMTAYTFSTSAQWPHYASYVGPNRTDLFTVSLPRSVAEIAAEPPAWHAEPVADTFVFPFWGGVSTRGSADTLSVSRRDEGEHGLVRFDLTGAPAATQAMLTLTIEGVRSGGDGFSLHRMLVPWTEGDSWNSLGGLIAGIHYLETPDATFAGPHGKGTFNLDVMSSVVPWQSNPGANHGWCVLGHGNQSKFRSRDWHASTERPLLTIR